ncbi:hypothetical protein GQ55_1G254500 [Panicum hallii var. hallii]|uniref:Uncharacterized protein n=1 Tax=Panicum hallii var. hallii TaxID=1504633 RepID=A0A2T7F7E8_9POAL|nr:hypothetical protein GQ55_1G254500 [Panicum hallii var. hallii]
MVDEYRIETSTDLILNPLNKRQTIITQSIEDDEVICLEGGFSYNKNAFEAALDNDEANLDDNSDFSSPYNIDGGPLFNTSCNKDSGSRSEETRMNQHVPIGENGKTGGENGKTTVAENVVADGKISGGNEKTDKGAHMLGDKISAAGSEKAAMPKHVTYGRRKKKTASQ